MSRTGFLGRHESSKGARLEGEFDFAAHMLDLTIHNAGNGAPRPGPPNDAGFDGNERIVGGTGVTCPIGVGVKA